MSIVDTLRGQPRGRLIAAGAALAVALIVVVALVLTGGDEEAAPETTTTTVAPTTTTPAPVGPIAPLTGLVVDDDALLARPALVVKIDIHPLARPSVGLAQADLVFEERVEGGVTRLAAVFHSQDAAEIGPVRSTRTTDLEIVSLFPRPLFASSGGNNIVMGQFRNADLVDTGHNISGEAFERMSGRPAPHNLFTSTEGLRRKGDPQGPFEPPLPLFEYLGDDDAVPDDADSVEGVAISFGSAEVARFTWDEDEAVWLRDLADPGEDFTPHVDGDGEQLAPTNVVIMEIEYDLSGQQGRSSPHGIITGEGPVTVLTGGRAVTGRWVRPSFEEPLQLLDDDDEPILLTPGQTFIELPPAGGLRFL